MNFPKQGRFESEVYLDYVRRLRCHFCGAPGPSHAHHFPGKGRSGATIDIDTMPVCARCHRRCHGETVDGENRIHDAQQYVAACATLALFFREASEQEWNAVNRDRLRWQRSRMLAVSW